MPDHIEVHPRVMRRHPELTPEDVAHAWGNRVAEAFRVGASPECVCAVGFDRAGRMVEMVAVELADGTPLVYHAMTPPSRKTLAEVGLG